MSAEEKIPFHLFTRMGTELEHISKAYSGLRLSGEGVYCEKSQRFLEKMYEAPLVVLTPSCTAALEMSMMLENVGPGDEVILPSFTFSSTALAVVSRGAIPVFVDIEDVDLNIDPEKILPAITKKTKAILPVHYAGVSAQMPEIFEIAKAHWFPVIEDAAQAIFSRAYGKPVGAECHLSTLSFHDTKNITCGEGGALIVNDPELVERAHIVRDKGTNRKKFMNGQVDKYTWVDEGSSFLMSEVQAAVLWAQLEGGQRVTERRMEICRRYRHGLQDLAADNKFRLPNLDPNNPGNGHIFYLRLPSESQREDLRQFLFASGITAISHYQALHSAPAGKKFGRTVGSMHVTEAAVGQILRLPLYFGMTDIQVDRVVRVIRTWCAENK